MSTPSHLNAQPLVWGHGPRTFEVFLEPTCPYSVRAFNKLDDLLDEVGADNVTIKIRLQSQPWHLFSGVIVRCILAASTLPHGREQAHKVMQAVADHREEFEFTDHCSGPNMNATPPTRVFESGNILLYLAEKFGFFLPKDPAGRTETLNWLFWLQGAAPFLGGGFGHFYNYAPVKIEYAIDRFTMEAKRQLDVLDKQLARGRYVAGEEYTIADMAVWPWYGNVVLGNVYNAAEFLDAGSYKNVLRWAQDVGNRPAVKRGRIVNRTNGPLNEQLHERHDARDFDTQTEDKRQA